MGGVKIILGGGGVNVVLGGGVTFVTTLSLFHLIRNRYHPEK